MGWDGMGWGAQACAWIHRPCTACPRQESATGSSCSHRGSRCGNNERGQSLGRHHEPTEQTPAAKRTKPAEDPTYSLCRSNDVMPESKERMRSRSSCTPSKKWWCQHQSGLRAREGEGGTSSSLDNFSCPEVGVWWVPAGEAATGLLLGANLRRQKMGKEGW